MRKVLIVGTSGSGKTSLGKRLATHLGAPYVDLDDLYWLPNWTKRTTEELHASIQAVLQNESWIICGNSWKLVWPEADTVIWLDVPLPKLLWRTLKRSIRRIRKGESCCNGNYETLARLCGKDSILLWILKSYRQRKRVYKQLFANGDGKRLFRLKISYSSKRWTDDQLAPIHDAVIPKAKPVSYKGHRFNGSPNDVEASIDE